MELLAGLARLQLGLRPLAAEHLQFRPVDAADPRISAHGLTVHPALTLVGPLTRALQIADVPTGGDRVAQDVACDPKAELAGGRRCRRLIEERQAFRDVALVHLAVALEARRHELHVGVAVLPGHRDGAIGVGEAVHHPMVEDGTHAGEQMEPGVHPRLGHALEETRGAPQPPAADRWRLAAEEHVREQEGHARGVDRSTGLDVGGERPLERIGRRIGRAGPPGGLAHPLEIVRRQAPIAIGRGERLERLRPGVTLEGVPAKLERTDRRTPSGLVVIERLPSDYPRRPQPATRADRRPTAPSSSAPAETFRPPAASDL